MFKAIARVELNKVKWTLSMICPSPMPKKDCEEKANPTPICGQDAAPRTRKQVRQFLGFANFYRRFLPPTP